MTRSFLGLGQETQIPYIACETLAWKSLSEHTRNLQARTAAPFCYSWYLLGATYLLATVWTALMVCQYEGEAAILQYCSNDVAV
jgi:hypothetical protein